MTLVSERSYNEDMRKDTLRGKLFAIIGKNLTNRLAVFRWSSQSPCSRQKRTNQQPKRWDKLPGACITTMLFSGGFRALRAVENNV